MNVFDKVRLVIYRFHEKGLEIFLINNKMESDPLVWKIPHGSFNFEQKLSEDDKLIKLEPVTDSKGALTEIYGIEGDWHDIPSIRGMIKHDLKRVRSKVKSTLPDLEQGSFFKVKDALKKVMPHEFEALLELNEVLVDRNSLRNL